MSISTAFARDGFYILSQVFPAPDIADMRKAVLGQVQVMSNTRPNPQARHLAGFHRYEALAGLHHRLAENPEISEALGGIYAQAPFRTIGLTDITVNRSQPWHTDLLRGKYARFLTPDICWGPDAAPCIKVLLYLQDGASLKVVAGSHSAPVPLADDHACVPGDPATVQSVPVKAGDVILMDIRLVHRGSTEDETIGFDLAEGAKILISTVFGATDTPMTAAMTAGNATRLADWDTQHLAG